MFRVAFVGVVVERGCSGGGGGGAGGGGGGGGGEIVMAAIVVSMWLRVFIRRHASSDGREIG